MGAAIYRFFLDIYSRCSWPTFVSRPMKCNSNFYLHQQPCGKYCSLQPNLNDNHPAQTKNFIMPLCGLSKHISQCSDDELDERDLYSLTNWLHDEANIVTSRAVRYAKLFLKDGLANMKRVAKHVHRHPNYLKDLNIHAGDIDEIKEAVGATIFLKSQNVEDNTKLDTIYDDISNPVTVVMTDNPMRDVLLTVKKATKRTHSNNNMSTEDDHASSLPMPMPNLMAEFDACLVAPEPAATTVPTASPSTTSVPAPTLSASAPISAPVFVPVSNATSQSLSPSLPTEKATPSQEAPQASSLPREACSSPKENSEALSNPKETSSSEELRQHPPESNSLVGSASPSRRNSPVEIPANTPKQTATTVTTSNSTAKSPTRREDSDDSFGYDAIYGSKAEDACNVSFTKPHEETFSSLTTLPLSDLASPTTTTSTFSSTASSTSPTPPPVLYPPVQVTQKPSAQQPVRRYQDSTTPPPGTTAALTALWASRSYSASANSSRSSSRCTSPTNATSQSSSSSSLVESNILLYRSKSCSQIIPNPKQNISTAVGSTNNVVKKKFKFGISPAYIPWPSNSSASTTPTGQNNKSFYEPLHGKNTESNAGLVTTPPPSK